MSRISLVRVVLLLATLLALTSGQRLLRAPERQLLAGADDLRVLKEVASASASASASESVNATAEESSTAAETETSAGTESESESEEGPTTASFTGPFIAGAVAIVLIGAVVAFKHRRSGQ